VKNIDSASFGTSTHSPAQFGNPTAMTLKAWDDNAPVGFDHELWAELCRLRFMQDAHDVIVVGPVLPLITRSASTRY
jgi:hypothetical protein